VIDGLLSQAANLWHQMLASLHEPGALLALVSAAVAALLVIVSTFVKTMIPLRWLAVGSNLGFVAYGLLQPAPLMVALHAVLLPVNLWRVWQMIRLTRRVAATVADEQQMQLWLRPYMRSRRHKAGSRLFERGDVAERLYFLVSGEVELPDVGLVMRAGQMFGEIAFFAPDHRRSSSAVCRSDCELMSIDDSTFRQLVYQNPDFGLQVVQLIAGRLTADVRRLQAAGGLQPGPAAAPAPAPPHVPLQPPQQGG
jgi:hypothetical protein